MIENDRLPDMFGLIGNYHCDAVEVKEPSWILDMPGPCWGRIKTEVPCLLQPQ